MDEAHTAAPFEPSSDRAHRQRHRSRPCYSLRIGSSTAGSCRSTARGRGDALRVYFPVAEEASGRAGRREDRHAGGAGGQETNFLVVEDQAQLRRERRCPLWNGPYTRALGGRASGAAACCATPRAIDLVFTTSHEPAGRPRYSFPDRPSEGRRPRSCHQRLCRSRLRRKRRSIHACHPPQTVDHRDLLARVRAALTDRKALAFHDSAPEADSNLRPVEPEASRRAPTADSCN